MNIAYKLYTKKKKKKQRIFSKQIINIGIQYEIYPAAPLKGANKVTVC